MYSESDKWCLGDTNCLGSLFTKIGNRRMKEQIQVNEPYQIIQVCSSTSKPVEALLLTVLSLSSTTLSLLLPLTVEGSTCRFSQSVLWHPSQNFRISLHEKNVITFFSPIFFIFFYIFLWEYSQNLHWDVVPWRDPKLYLFFFAFLTGYFFIDALYVDL